MNSVLIKSPNKTEFNEGRGRLFATQYRDASIDYKKHLVRTDSVSMLVLGVRIIKKID